MLNRDVFHTDPDQYRIANQGVAKITFPPSPAALVTLQSELQTFVCDGEYAKALVTILEGFLREADRGVTPCVWISGFYGSGKSHLANVLAALWTDLQFPDNSRASTIIRDLPADIVTALRELRTVAKRVGGIHVAGDELGGGADDAVGATVGIVLRSAGLPADIRTARVAFWLADEGILDTVTAALGDRFETEIRNFVLSTRFAEAVLAAKPAIAASPKELRENLRANFPQPDKLTVDDLVIITRQALTLKHKKLPLTLIVLDEVQQFVRADPARALDMQNIAERLSKDMDGRVLFVCTGQQALADVPNLQKLLGRFPIRISLKEADIEGVIRKTVLRKKPETVPAIAAKLGAVAGEVSRHLANTRDQHGPNDDADAPADWPLLPSRRRVWERILRSLDRSGLAGTLRTQLAVALDAARHVAAQPLGFAVAGDYLYDRFADDALNAGLLPRETRLIIERLRTGSDDDKLKSRILKLVYMLGEIRQGVDQHGVRARTDIIADLLVEDLTNSADLRRRVPDLLKQLHDAAAILEVDGEWRIQTKEGAEWEIAFRTAERIRQANLTDLDRERRDALNTALTAALGNFGTITQGRSSEPRKINRLFGMTDKAPTDGVPVRVHSGFEVDLKDITNQIIATSPDDPTVHVLIPRHRATELSAELARWLAANDVLGAKGVPEGDGKQARAGMETRLTNARRQIEAIVREAVDKAEVRLSGGAIVDGALDKAVRAAATSALVRIYPKFADADHPKWGTALTRAQKGALDALNEVDFSPDGPTHPVCKAILAMLGAGKKGLEIRQSFTAPPYGWPTDAIGAALVMLDNAGIIVTRDEAQKIIPARSVTAQKLGTCSFRPETVTIALPERLAVRGLGQALGVPVVNDREADALPAILQALASAAAAAGGEAPAPPAPTIPDLATITALSGNEQLKEIASRVPALRASITAWKAAAAAIGQRLPAWLLAERLVALGAAGQHTALDAIRTGRRLLENPDPVPPLVQDAAADLRTRLNTAWAAYDAAWNAGQAKLHADPSWQKLTADDHRAIRESCGLLQTTQPAVAAPHDIVAALTARPLSGWTDLSKSLPTRVDDAIAEAAALLEPKAITLTLPGAILKTEDDLTAWLERLRAAIAPKLAGNPVIPKV
jgi:hypothetical protein